jgi:deoxyribonuclease IV
MREIGGHVSAAGGVELAMERAVAIGGNAVQIFSGSPRVWARPDIAKFDKEKIVSKKEELGIRSIFTHSLYLVNLASDNPELIRKSMEALAFDLRFDAHLNGSGVFVHVGSHKGNGWETVRDQVLRQIAALVEDAPDGSHFLIENAASQNGKIGGTLEEVRWLVDELKSEKVGWCFDTCHAHAAGYGLGKSQPDSSGQERTAAEEIERLGLWSSLRCVHVNDSRDPFASGRDRHDNLGTGLIPTTDMEYFLNLPQVQNIPLILEVPGVEGNGPDLENVQRLKKLVHES